MKNAFVLAKKDIKSYFHSWTGVLVFTFFMVLAGIFFCMPILAFAKVSVTASQQGTQGLEGLGFTRFVFSAFFLNLGMILIFVVPFLSMRAFAEEKSQQTLELLFSYPFSDFDIVVGKLLGMIGFFILLMLPTLFYLGFLTWTHADLDGGPIVMGYFGFLLLAMAYLSLGLFISAISENQVVSAVVTFGILVVFWILEWITGVTDGSWSHFLSMLSPLNHFRDFPLGIVDLSHIVYFIFFHLYFLFLTMRAIETRHWKG